VYPEKKYRKLAHKHVGPIMIFYQSGA